MTTPDFQPWQGCMLQIDPASGRLLAVTVAAQTIEAHEKISAMMDTLLAILNSPHALGN
jgi:hypothetical protein